MNSLITILQTLLCAIFICTSVQAQFELCNTPTTKTLKDVYFINADIGIAVGDSGVIVRTIDGGENWSLIMDNDSRNFSKVKFFDTQNGIITGSHIYTTSDAGQNWMNRPYPNQQFIDIEILNPTTCIVSGTPTALIKSTDFGVNWTVLVEEQTVNSDYGLLSFIDENTGYACGYGGGAGTSTHTLKTTNGGDSWVLVEAPFSQYSPTVMETMSFVSEDTGFKGGWYNPHLQKTVNGGNDWAYVSSVSQFFDSQLYDFHIEANQPNSYYACGWYGNIYKSTDGGDSWIELNSGVSDITSLYGIFFLDDVNGWVVGAYGTILKTTTGGTVGLEQSENKLDISVFPNPTDGIVQVISKENHAIKAIKLFDLNGRFIESYTNNESINISHFPKGEYFLYIEFSKGTAIKKVVRK